MKCDMQTISNGILLAVGNTPLINLDRVIRSSFQLYAKLEMLNPGGSIKDRTAVNMVMKAIEREEINSATTIIESSSGNLGIGLAMVCKYLGMRFICVVDPKTTAQNIKLLKAFDAEIDIVKEPDLITGEYLQARINRVKFLVNSMPNAFWCNQYANLDNAAAHYETMREIIESLDRRPPDYLFCATSTCGTLRGCSDFIRFHKLKTKIIAVDAHGSIIFGGKRQKRLIPGHGSAIIPDLLVPGLEDEQVYVSDLDCVIGCRRLLAKEAIIAGGSSGGIITAIEKKAHDIPAGAICVALLCDRGERYFDTIYSDEWVQKNFGDVFHLWQER
jgi:cysteine synthase A